MADFDVPGAADLTITAPATSVTIDDDFRVPGAAQFAVDPVSPEFVQELVFDVPAPATIGLEGVGPAFLIEDTFQVLAAAFLTISGPQPAYLEGNIDRDFHPGVALFDILGPQPLFAMGPPFHQNFNPATAGRFTIVAPQPLFEGGAEIPLSRPVFPFPHTGEADIVERRGHLSSVLTARQGSEQRIQLRELATGALTLSILVTREDVQRVRSVLYALQGRLLHVPRWQYASPLSASASASATAVNCDTTNIPFLAGGLVVLWKSPTDYEVNLVQSVGSGVLNLALGLTANRAAHETLVVPLLPGRLSEEEDFTWLDLDVGQLDVTFQIEGFP